MKKVIFCLDIFEGKTFVGSEYLFTRSDFVDRVDKLVKLGFRVQTLISTQNEKGEWNK